MLTVKTLITTTTPGAMIFMNKVCRKVVGRCKGSTGLSPVRVSTLQSIQEYLDTLEELQVSEAAGIKAAMRVSYAGSAFITEPEKSLVAIAANI